MTTRTAALLLLALAAVLLWLWRLSRGPSRDALVIPAEETDAQQEQALFEAAVAAHARGRNGS